MQILECTNSIAIVGEEFNPGLFEPNDFIEDLGAPDFRQTIVLPMMALYVFPKTATRILLEPQKLDFQRSTIREGDREPEVLPELLREMITPIILGQGGSASGISIKAMGFNCNFVVSLEDMGIDGLTFCRNEFLVSKDGIERRIGGGHLVANQAKLIYDWEGLKVNMDVAPHFNSEGHNLYLGVNVHQEFGEENTPIAGLERFDQIKQYIQTLPHLFFGN